MYVFCDSYMKVININKPVVSYWERMMTNITSFLSQTLWFLPFQVWKNTEITSTQNIFWGKESDYELMKRQLHTVALRRFWIVF